MELMYVPLPSMPHHDWVRITHSTEYTVLDGDTVTPLACLRHRVKGEDGSVTDQTLYYADVTQFDEWLFFTNVRKTTRVDETEWTTPHRIPDYCRILAGSSLYAQGLAWLMWLEEQGEAAWMVEAA